MTINELKELILFNLKDNSKEFKRVFHGRGNYYQNFHYLTVDIIDKILFVTLYENIDNSLENELKELLEQVSIQMNIDTLVLQKRYQKENFCEVLKGKLAQNIYAIENNLKYTINFTNQNIGLFPDMKVGREFIASISKDKNILNLFSYTCAFSVVALNSGAKQVVNVDMAKGALSIGRDNHRINNLDTSKVKFLPYNILKSWSRIKKFAPYDIIIIDPPSFQKGSFAASKDYEKIIKRLNELASSDCIVLSCLNAPELDTTFMKDLFSKFASEFEFVKRLENLETFPSNNEEKTLKNMIFKRKEMINPKLCPFCGQQNLCEAHILNNNCWCNNIKVPTELRVFIPEEKRMKACICQKCILDFKENSELFIQKYNLTK
ncbi:cysteine-rich CWC family protein [Arcobacter sp.]|uniref:cysteine-rich CWC family protein n=1 Tax=Arcobacter sp. TaxID=1872629 RepID=UPI003D1192D2